MYDALCNPGPGKPNYLYLTEFVDPRMQVFQMLVVNEEYEEFCKARPNLLICMEKLIERYPVGKNPRLDSRDRDALTCFLSGWEIRSEALLCIAINANYVLMIDVLLKNNPSLIQMKCAYIWDETSVYRAAKVGHAEALEVLLNHVTLPEVKDELLQQRNRNGQLTAVYVAAEAGHEECLKVLLSYVSSPDVKDGLLKAKNYGGRTPVHMAAKAGHEEC